MNFMAVLFETAQSDDRRQNEDFVPELLSLFRNAVSCLPQVACASNRQCMPQVAHLRFAALRLLVQPGIWIGGRLMRFVAALLSVKIHLPPVRRGRFASILPAAAEALSDLCGVQRYNTLLEISEAARVHPRRAVGWLHAQVVQE
jgi:hypothetical protein